MVRRRNTFPRQRTDYFFDLDFDLFFDFRCLDGPFLLAFFLPVPFLPDPFLPVPFFDDACFFLLDFTDAFFFAPEAFVLVDGFFFFAVFFLTGLLLEVVVAVLWLLLRLLFFAAKRDVPVFRVLLGRTTVQNGQFQASQVRNNRKLRRQSLGYLGFVA